MTPGINVSFEREVMWIFVPNSPFFFTRRHNKLLKELLTFAVYNFSSPYSSLVHCSLVSVLTAAIVKSNGPFPDLILFSVLATFDTVDHSFFLKALFCFGFRDFTFSWFFSSCFSSWFFSASFRGFFLCPFPKCWCSSGLWFRSSFLHTPHRWWIALSTPMASITIDLQIILKYASVSLFLSLSDPVYNSLWKHSFGCVMGTSNSTFPKLIYSLVSHISADGITSHPVFKVRNWSILFDSSFSLTLQSQ